MLSISITNLFAGLPNNELHYHLHCMHQSMNSYFGHLPLLPLFVAIIWAISHWFCSVSFFKRTMSPTLQFLVEIFHFVPVWRSNNTIFLHLLQNLLQIYMLYSPQMFSAILIWRCENTWGQHYNLWFHCEKVYWA